jgi:hypothetical protein
VIEWKRQRDNVPSTGVRFYDCCQPVDPVVIKVVVEPEPGEWETRYRHAGEVRRGRADSIERAKEAALQAAEDMLRESLGELVRKRARAAERVEVE